MAKRLDFPRGLGETGIEPERTGMYVDRDGDIWEKREDGWRLMLQRGVAVDPMSLWDWTDGHVRDYAPFMPVSARR
ncbi:hypothetical protein [Nocardia seriolae]|uniref:Uncharacterized protein n=1 Tax=Nocardia seriolae TaxID=37332 RepID=A0A0B8NCQ2_9NOCA|nr:hypothetical protein [Nocardia seriolae]MTJ75410.1 hypothetical protein [Nocardia seriolae]MTJ90520.1 hypothetical protein [Nocardia seriolae]MTK39332.1 hypothetical protein [Nocardia seriolae]MTK51095.1 hypothetical protein [Nocardia seriolae]MTL16065.1 hypothetical protein [Nocardia seriolae]